MGQRYLTSVVRAKGDSVLRANFGDSIYKYCSFVEEHSGYMYENSHHETDWGFLNTKKTIGKFKNAQMIWKFVIPYPKCHDMDTIVGETWINFDSLLQPEFIHPLDFIPDIYWNGDSCHFFNKDKAIKKARWYFDTPGIFTIKAAILYDIKNKIFTWEICQVTKPKNSTFDEEIEEVVIIDAITGVYKEKFTRFYNVEIEK